MHLLIVSATHDECAPLTDALTPVKQGAVLSTYVYNSINVDVLVTGVGMVATTYALSTALAGSSYDLALNMGIAGSFDRGVKIGDVVVVASDMFSELGVEDGDGFIPLYRTGLGGVDFPFNQHGKIVNTFSMSTATTRSLPDVKGITVNTVHGNMKTIQAVNLLFAPQVETMEGAAFLYVCLMNKLPCLQIRSISNFVEQRNKSGWNIQLAIRNLNDTVKKIIHEL